MFTFKTTLEGDKQQLQHLNNRLAHYLSRTQRLEHENAHLVAKVSELRRDRTEERDLKYKADIQQLRRKVEQLCVEKSRVEMERERLWKELQVVRCLCTEQTEARRDISGNLKGCMKDLQEANHKNKQLQQRLLQLEMDYQQLEDAQSQVRFHLGHQSESRVAPNSTLSRPPAVPVEELQEYARHLSEGWEQTFDMYQQKVEEMQRTVREEQVKLGELEREKLLCFSQMDKMRTEVEKQGNIRLRLEEQLLHMQEKYRLDCGKYQMIVAKLEQERNIMADTMAKKMSEHQHLLLVKMDLGKEVAAYRALLEGETLGPQYSHRRVNPHQRERIIEIKMPAQLYTPRAAIFNTRDSTNIRYTAPASNVTISPRAASGSTCPSRVIPISVTERARHKSPTSRHNIISFNTARGATSFTPPGSNEEKQTVQRGNQTSPNGQKTIAEEKVVDTQQVSKVDETKKIPVESCTTENISTRVTSLQMSRKKEEDSENYVSNEKDNKSIWGEFRNETSSETNVIEKKILDSVTVEDIIEKVMKPAGLEARFCASGDGTVLYHIQKTEQEDGTTKTQLTLESKVEEELEVEKDSSLNELLSHGVKKMTLENLEDTATGSMIKTLLSELQSQETLQNKSISVEIIEEPVESASDEDLEEEQKGRSTPHEPSTYIQIQGLEDVPNDSLVKTSDNDESQVKARDVDEDLKTYMFDENPPESIQNVCKESDSCQFFDDQQPKEYFVSTPDENLSELEEGSGITSYDNYGIAEDLSDEWYCQDVAFPHKQVTAEENDEYKFTSDDSLLAKEGFPECVIEEEVRVSSRVQESVLEFLRENSLEPKDQLKGALEKLQSSVSGPLREELAFLTKVSSENLQNVAIDIKKVQQSSDDGSTTIVAELNVSQNLEDSGLLETGFDMSEEQIMAVPRSSNIGFEDVFQGRSGGDYRVSKAEDIVYDGGFDGGSEEGGSVNKAMSFQADANRSTFGTTSHHQLSFHNEDTPLKISHEKSIATVYLEDPSED